jgi:hypothetical protein
MKRFGLTFVLITAGLASENPWQPLFDGKSFAGWRKPSGEPVGAGWRIEDGAIHRAAKAGDIVTTREFLDFELEFEWKTAPGANGGLKYRVADYSPAGKNIGLEFQILDDAVHADGRNRRTSAASIYQLAAPSVTKRLNPPGEWNRSKIVADGMRLEHWLNGEKAVTVTIGSEEWKQAHAASKFRASPDFGTKKGRILIQDHGDVVWFRNLRLREISK